jgi:hypothetical protein
MQMWVVLILSHLVYALRERIARAADCDPFEVSVPLLVDLLPQLCDPSKLSLEQLVQSGRQLGRLACEPTSRAECTPGRAFELSVSSARSTQATTGTCSIGTAQASS